MDVISGYKTGGTITGDVLIDGRPKDPAIWKKISGYAEQNDILNPYLSVSHELVPWFCSRWRDPSIGRCSHIMLLALLLT